jgi:hypothetical protein
VRYLGVWESPARCAGGRFDYELIERRPGELIVTAPDAY